MIGGFREHLVVSCHGDLVEGVPEEIVEGRANPFLVAQTVAGRQREDSLRGDTGHCGEPIERLQEVGFTAVGLADDADDGIYDRPCPVGRIALVAGDEGGGLSRLARERCDVVVSIPMRGRVSSLNVSASVAAALYGYVLPANVPRPSGSPRR